MRKVIYWPGGVAKVLPLAFPSAQLQFAAVLPFHWHNRCSKHGQFVKVLKKILLIDHDTRVTHIVRRALKTAGKYSIREEHDAAFAIHVARWFRPDLVMINLTAPATDGKIIADQLQKDAGLGDVPLVCLSNFVLERQFLSAGMLRGYSFLAAPVKIDQLLRAVEQLLFAKSDD